MMSRIYQSVGMAFLFVPINTMAFYFIPKEKTNNATGIINLARNIGGSFGIANVTTMLARRMQVHQNILASHVTPFSHAYQSMVASAKALLETRGADPAQAAAQANGLIYGMVQRQASMLAFVDVFWLLGVTFLVMIPLLFLMKKTKPHAAPLVAD